jgi:DNA-binding MarR family transcriptional regulator
MTAAAGEPAAEEASSSDLIVLRAALYRFQRLQGSRRVHAQIAQLAGVGVSQQARQLLEAMSPAAAMPVGEIAKAARMDLGAVSRKLTELEQAGLATRRGSPDHGSVVLVELTPSGKRAARAVSSVRDRHLADTLAEWSDSDRATFGRLLGQFVDDLQRTPLRPSSRVLGA